MGLLESLELLGCVVHFQESLCWQIVVSALITAFMVRNFLPERGDLILLSGYGHSVSR